MDPYRLVRLGLALASIAVLYFLFSQERALAVIPKETLKGQVFPVFITSYNPVKGQTDETPCHGASGRDLCLAAKEGDRTVAISQDLLKFFRFHEKVKVVSKIPQCNGVYSIEDTMNKRFTNRADLFFMTRKENTSCNATIQKLVYSDTLKPR